jgi:hypothetical protein
MPRLSLLGALLAAAAMAGCQGSIHRPDVGELTEGLNLLDVSDPSWGSNVAYVKDKRVVYLETRVGALKPEIYRLTWPDDSANEIDFRFIDQTGHTFYVQRAGDVFVDPSWEEDIAAHAKIGAMDLKTRDLDFQLAKEAATAFGLAAPTNFHDHVIQMGAIHKEPLPSQNAEAQTRFEAAKAELAETGRSNAWVADTWVDSHLYSGSTGCFAWICAARHSATRMYTGYPNLVQVQNACNHGRCYNGSGMGYHCGSYGWRGGGAYVNGETNSSGVGVSGGCLTPYNWNSGGYDHLCNSDAAYELWQAKSGSKYTTQGDGYSFVWDSGGNNYACNCNNNDNCDGDWNRPGCP